MQQRQKFKLTIVGLVMFISMPAMADLDTGAMLGGGLGGAVGATVGSYVGGRTGAIIGGAVGGAGGAAVGARRNQVQSYPAYNNYTPAPSYYQQDNGWHHGHQRRWHRY